MDYLRKAVNNTKGAYNSIENQFKDYNVVEQQLYNQQFVYNEYNTDVCEVIVECDIGVKIRDKLKSVISEAGENYITQINNDLKTDTLVDVSKLTTITNTAVNNFQTQLRKSIEIKENEYPCKLKIKFKKSIDDMDIETDGHITQLNPETKKFVVKFTINNKTEIREFDFKKLCINGCDPINDTHTQQNTQQNTQDVQPEQTGGTLNRKQHYINYNKHYKHDSPDMTICE